MMPLPNVTGALHMGHAFNLTLQDILVRYFKMNGNQVLWQPGIDHAGIATQIVVQDHLEKQGINAKELPRHIFLEKIWAWKEQCGDDILKQQRLLNICPNWERTQFTMEPHFSKAVNEVLVRLYKQGLVYQDEKLSNWDPKLQTALSNLEVKNDRRKGYTYFIRYLLCNNANESLTIATTRPETMFGDAALAVNPEDQRYQAFIGQSVHIPLTKRTIPIIADHHSDPRKGTGAVKITPAHDFNDFDVGKRHHLSFYTIMDQNACMYGRNVPQAYQGLSCLDARKKIIQDLEQSGLLEKTERIDISLPIGERSQAIIEPRLTKQWFINMSPLAKKALQAVEDKETIFIPENWTTLYKQWLENIQPWCVSRQICWGHPLPIWYGPDHTVFVARSEEEAHNDAQKHYGTSVILKRDPDVLDTWFSSALWPFVTLGWPEKTKEMELFYPTTTLVTGFDIIFFWVARMMMFGIHFTGKAPFSQVYAHALVLDEKGQKMSKTKGNGVDPLLIIEEYGADCLRFGLSSQATPGRDLRFSLKHMEKAKHFITKLWSCARFYASTRGSVVIPNDIKKPTHFLNQWIVGECETLVQNTTKTIENFRYDLALQSIYQFVWTRFCDWYIEFSKVLLNIGRAAEKEECQNVMGSVLQTLLKVLHPFIPKTSEEIWTFLFHPTLLHRSEEASTQVLWPISIDHARSSEEAFFLINLISALRTARGTVNAPPQIKAPLHTTAKDIERFLPYLERLAQVSHIKYAHNISQEKTLSVVVDNLTYGIPLEGLIDIQKERKRLQKTIQASEQVIQVLEKKMMCQHFLDRAPQEVVQKNQARLAEEKHKLNQAYDALACLR